jgi:uncharacterized zinc-type alcohol dehydrogenase-like protein
MTIERREVGPKDVLVAVEYCGICHSDIHTARNEWHGTAYPAVPGHEIVGRVVAIGPSVTAHSVGDRVAVGCMVSSCGECPPCRAGEENYCQVGATFTYNSVDPTGTVPRTYGGYSGQIVVTEHFVVPFPEELDPAAGAPILCAGVTMYSPLKHWNVGPGSAVGIAGFGGLGSMGVKLAKALGAEVTVITRTDRKAADALKAGADHVLVSSDPAQMAAADGSLDVILSTIPSSHSINPYLSLLKRDGAYVILGAIEPLHEMLSGGLLARRRVAVTGSMIGGIAETNDVLRFCAEHGIASDIEIIGVDGINRAYDEMAAGDPGFRYVIDMSTIGA